MAEIEKYVPFVIYWETGVRDEGAGNKELFVKAKAKGIVNDPDDTGGATLVGITFSTYATYLRNMPKREVASPEEAAFRFSENSTMERFRRLSYIEWRDMLKRMFWDRWKADEIRSQMVAEMLVDWVWTSGKYGIILPQKLLDVPADGIVGPRTLAAVNRRDSGILFKQLKAERLAYIDRICKGRPANKKFRNGWRSRINSCGLDMRPKPGPQHLKSHTR